MAFVKTFRVNPEYGVPDREIRDWLTSIEDRYRIIISTQMIYLPEIGKADPRITVIATKLDDAASHGDFKS